MRARRMLLRVARLLVVPAVLLAVATGGCDPGPSTSTDSAMVAGDSESPPQSTATGSDRSQDIVHATETGERYHRARQLTPQEDSVLLSSMVREWGHPRIPTDLLATGTKTDVDTDLGLALSEVPAPYVITDPDFDTDRESELSLRDGTPHPWEVLGRGLYVIHYPGSPAGAHFYCDESETRLIALEGPHFGCDTMILSTVSRHPARLLVEDLTALRTESGVGLGNSRDRLIQLLGEPSCTSEIGEYEILYYLGKPFRFEIRSGVRAGEVDLVGWSAIYAVRESRVVEIMLHSWSTKPGP